MDVNCQAITNKGIACGSLASFTGLCKVHNHARIVHGPNKFSRTQLENAHKKELNQLKDRRSNMDYTTYESDFKIAIGKFESSMQELIRTQTNEMKWSRIDPDSWANARKKIARDKLDARREETRRIRMLIADVRRRQLEVELGIRAYDDVYENIHVVRQLRDIVADPQSVHTSEAVRQTKEIVDKVRSISVPDEYMWSKETCSKTPGEIIAECKLSMDAAMQMMNQYSSDVAVYDIEEGIYGKVLDSVWQFVKNSDDKLELCGILKQEMEDNIGMCAQGNLTRICNILAGYLDGISIAESLSEKLGRLLPPLLDIEDIEERNMEATRIFTELLVPENERNSWLDAVLI